MSFEQFEETFRQTFGREMTRHEREWLRPASFVDDSRQERASLDPKSYGPVTWPDERTL